MPCWLLPGRPARAAAFCFCILAGFVLPLGASPAWVGGERLADVLMYHHLLDELRFDEAGQVLDRLLASGRRNPHLRVLEAEYALQMHAQGRAGDWLERAGRASHAAVASEAAGWRGQMARSRWNEVSGNMREALLCAKLALEDEQAPRAAWERALTLAEKLGDRGEMGQLLEGAKDRGFLDANGLYTLGMIRLSEGRLPEAIADLEGAQRSGHSGLSVRAANALVVLYRERLDFEKAERTLVGLAAAFPAEAVYRQHKILLDFMRHGIPRQTVSLAGLDLAAVRQPEHLAVLLLVSGDTNGARRIVGMTNDSPGYAGAMVQFFLAAEPGRRAGLAIALAGRAMQEGSALLAGSWLGQARSLLGNSAMSNMAWLRLQARVSLARGISGEAAGYASRLLEIQPRDGEAMGLLAAACVQLGRYDEALRLFMDAGDGDGLLAAALTRAREGQHELAVRYTRALLSRAPLHAEAVRIQALSLEHLKKTNEALDSLGGWYRKGGRDVSAVAVYARLEMARGRVQSALQLIDEALSRLPAQRSSVTRGDQGDLADLLLLRGRGLLTTGRPRQAEAAFARAAAMGGLSRERQIELSLWHGDALMAIGRSTSALAAWRRVQELQPGEARSLQRITAHERVTRRTVP